MQNKFTTFEEISNVLYEHLLENKKVSKINGIHSVDDIEDLLRTFVALNISRKGQLNGLNGDEYNVENYGVIKPFFGLLLPGKLVAYGDESMPDLLGKDFRNSAVEGKVLDFSRFNGIQKAILLALKLEPEITPVLEVERFSKFLVLEQIPSKYFYEGETPVIELGQYELGLPLNTNLYNGEFIPTQGIGFVWKKVLENSFK